MYSNQHGLYVYKRNRYIVILRDFSVMPIESYTAGDR